MFRYIIRRILQMIPTDFVVIVITFILFNYGGGSTAAMTLGKNISPKALEEFDEQRGFNKPLLLGRWSATRAYEDATFAPSDGNLLPAGRNRQDGRERTRPLRRWICLWPGSAGLRLCVQSLLHALSHRRPSPAFFRLLERQLVGALPRHRR